MKLQEADYASTMLHTILQIGGQDLMDKIMIPLNKEPLFISMLLIDMVNIIFQYATENDPNIGWDPYDQTQKSNF